MRIKILRKQPRAKSASSIQRLALAVVGVAMISTLMALPVATANIIGNDTANFNPNPSGLDFVTVHGSDTLGYGILNGGLFFNRAKNTLPATRDLGMNKVDPEDTVTFMDFGFAYGLTDHFEVGLSFSTLLDQQIEKSAPGAQFAATGLNDIRLLTKYQFLEKQPVGAAIAVSMDVNQARNNPFSGQDAGPTVNFEGVLDWEYRKVHFSTNLGYRMRSPGTPITGALYQPLPDQWVASAATSYYFSKLDMKLIAEGFLAKSMKAVQELDAGTISTEFLVGAKFDLSPRFATHLGFGSRLADGLFTPEWRVYVGLNYTFDFIRAPAVAHAPKPTAPVKEPVVVKQYYKGYLPEDIEKLHDVDFDEMARRHEFQLRTDVPDAMLAGQKPPFEILRLQGFDFDFGSDVIRPEHYPTLDRLAAYLKAAPQVVKIRIEGHTDSIGSDDRKRRLGLRRSERVAAYLREKGALDGIDVQPVGYGADRPIADNGNFQGRKLNRRVEIRILRRLEEPPVRVK